MPKSEYKTMVDFYREYPYKKQHYPTHQPYVSKEDSTDEEMSITYPEWRKAIKIYYKYVCLYLAQGYVYRFSSGIGELRVVKYKSKKQPPDFAKIRKIIMKEKGCTYGEAAQYITKELVDRHKHLNKDIDGFRWNIGWFRREYNFKNKSYWNYALPPLVFDLMNTLVRKNIHKISLTDWMPLDRNGKPRKLRKTFT